MGGIIKVNCECGFETDFMGGSGSENFETVCKAPALCLSCNKFVVENYMDKGVVCPDCKGKITYYDDVNLQEREGEEGEAPVKTTIFILPDAKCLCPKCGKKQMKFKHVGCWA